MHAHTHTLETRSQCCPLSGSGRQNLCLQKGRHVGSHVYLVKTQILRPSLWLLFPKAQCFYTYCFKGNPKKRYFFCLRCLILIQKETRGFLILQQRTGNPHPEALSDHVKTCQEKPRETARQLTNRPTAAGSAPRQAPSEMLTAGRKEQSQQAGVASSK